MKKYTSVQNKSNMLAVKVNYPDKYLCKTIDQIADMLLEYGDYKIVEFGLSSSNFNNNFIKFDTNLPWIIFENK